jgi:hypothetical protein
VRHTDCRPRRRYSGLLMLPQSINGRFGCPSTDAEPPPLADMTRMQVLFRWTDSNRTRTRRSRQAAFGAGNVPSCQPRFMAGSRRFFGYVLVIDA